MNGWADSRISINYFKPVILSLNVSNAIRCVDKVNMNGINSMSSIILFFPTMPLLIALRFMYMLVHVHVCNIVKRSRPN